MQTAHERRYADELEASSRDMNDLCEAAAFGRRYGIDPLVVLMTQAHQLPTLPSAAIVEATERLNKGR